VGAWGPPLLRVLRQIWGFPELFKGFLTLFFGAGFEAVRDFSAFLIRFFFFLFFFFAVFFGEIF